jgi:hypothetical protein
MAIERTPADVKRFEMDMARIYKNRKRTPVECANETLKERLSDNPAGNVYCPRHETIAKISDGQHLRCVTEPATSIRLYTFICHIDSVPTMSRPSGMDDVGVFRYAHGNVILMETCYNTSEADAVGRYISRKENTIFVRFL